MLYPIAMRSAFSRGNTGGNPAGILICESLPTRQQMLAIAADVGAAETVFAQPLYSTNNSEQNKSAADHSHWILRYFSPEQEVPFCGHATVALTAELFARYGTKNFVFSLARQDIAVRIVDGKLVQIRSPEPGFEYVDKHLQQTVLDIFNLQTSDLINPQIALVNAGANHLALELNNRQTLAAMNYAFNTARTLMQKREIATVALFYRESPFKIVIRNAFAFGGLYEDPATGAGAAAVAGYLHATDPDYNAGDTIEFKQGDDMGQPCTLLTRLPDKAGQPITLMGETRQLPAKSVELR